MESNLIKLTAKQNQCIYHLRDDDIRETVYGGAAGGGKTALGCFWLIEMSLKYPKSRWLMGRSKLKTLRETTLKTFFDLTALMGMTHLYNYNSQDYVITWYNGSEIVLKDLFLYPSDPNFDSLGSLEICGAFIDEVNQIVHKAWQVVLSRCRYKLKEFDIKPRLLGSCNPAKNWVYKQFYQPSKKGTLKKGRAFLQALPTDNPHLPPEYLESLLSLDKNSRERLYYGNWEYDNDPAALISYDAIMDYFKPAHIEPTGTKYMTIDVARKGKDSTVFRVWDGLLVIERFRIAKSGLVEVVNKATQLRIKHNIPLSHIVADEDGVGGGVVDFLRCKGFVNGSRAMKEMVGNEYIVPNYQNLRSQCGFKMAQLIETRQAGEMNLSADDQDTVSEEMEQIKQKDIDKDGKIAIIPKDIIKEKIGRSPDEWDSIMMRYFFELEPKVFTF